MNTVTYRDEVLNEFRNNLLIEAMPEPREPEQAANDLMIFPEYHDSDRKRSTAQRRILTQNIARIHHPLLREVEVEGAIDRCIRWGYADRNPLSPEYAAQLSAGYTAAVNNLGLQHAGGYHPHTYGFSILGISGIGKSTTVEAILSYYTQVIRHTLYKGIDLSLTQITYMKLDCPADGSLKGLCLAFFKLLDKLVGTDYHEQYQKRTTLDFMMLKMAQLTMTYNVGLIVIDELQNLCTASKDVPAKVLNFLVTLVNTIGVPVVMIGTSKALSILQSEFQQAKRGSGQGDFLWERMKNDGEWDTFCKAIWPFQYTRNEVPYSDEMRNALYSEALGIPFLAVHIYKLVQEDAILYGKETFASKDFKRIANKKMGLTKPMRDAIRVGKEVDLRQFVDIAPFTLEDYRENYSVAAEAKAPSRKLSEKPDPRKAATLTLMGLGLSQPEADNFVCRAIANLKECTLDTQIVPQLDGVEYCPVHQVRIVSTSIHVKDFRYSFHPADTVLTNSSVGTITDPIAPSPYSEIQNRPDVFVSMARCVQYLWQHLPEYSGIWFLLNRYRQLLSIPKANDLWQSASVVREKLLQNHQVKLVNWLLSQNETVDPRYIFFSQFSLAQHAMMISLLSPSPEAFFLEESL